MFSERMATVARARIALALVASTSVCSGAVALAAPAPTAEAARVSVKVTTCSKGQAAADRTAVFRAGMRTIGGASRLSVRFTLKESAAGAAYRPIKAPGLGVWRRSRAGVGSFAYRQRVRALAQGSSYYVTVQYRWQNAKGKVLKRASARSRTCRQRQARPNLAVQRIGARKIDGAPRRAQYAITLINRGSAPAPASNLKLFADGSTVGRAPVPALPIGRTAKVLLTAPKCSVNITAEADPDLLVRESDEADNARTAACPFG